MLAGRVPRPGESVRGALRSRWLRSEGAKNREERGLLEQPGDNSGPSSTRAPRQEGRTGEWGKIVSPYCAKQAACGLNRNRVDSTRLFFLSPLSHLSKWSSSTWESENKSCSVMSDSLSMEFSRPEHWSGSPFPSPGDLPNPGINLRTPALQADCSPAEPQGSPVLGEHSPKTRNGPLNLLTY